jgi:ATP-dependent helicase/nuclease subunit B
VVTAKADRIDRAPDGRYAIYDYKSGSVPGDKEARAFHLQLPLEAAIAEAGGFEGLPPAPAAHLELIGLNGRNTLALDSDPASIARAWAHLAELVAHYQDPAQGFTARLRPQRLTYVSDYDHLARHGEWDDGDTPEGGTEEAP